MTVVHCPHCGGVVQLAMLPVGRSAGAAAARASTGTPRDQADAEQAPLCASCGQRRVNRRRDGTWFRTCVRCG